MVRVTKDPEERRKELIDIAEALFSRKGYEKVAVSDIVKKAKVAQGTFYYYFKTKEEMLDAIVDKMIEDVENHIERFVNRDDVDPLMKFFGLNKLIRTVGKDHEKLVEYLHKEQNAHLHLRVEKRIFPIILPIIEQSIKQGVKEGIFNTRYPREAALFILASSSMLSAQYPELAGRTDINWKEFKGWFNMYERILGAKPGTIMRYYRKMEELDVRKK